jgi:hypothetical protein
MVATILVRRIESKVSLGVVVPGSGSRIGGARPGVPGVAAVAPIGPHA